MRENWKLYLETTKTKAKGHGKAAQYWDTMGMYMSLALIFLGSLTTFMALVHVIPTTFVAGIAGVGTMLSAVQAFLRPADRRQQQSYAAREFQELMMRMVRCEEEAEYEELWRDLNKAIVDAPFLPKRFKTDIDIDWTMTPELNDLIDEKEGPAPEESVEIDSEKTSSVISDESKSKQRVGALDNFGYGSIGNFMQGVSKGDEEKIELLRNE